MVYKIDLTSDTLRCLDNEYPELNGDFESHFIHAKDSHGRDLLSYLMFRERISDELISLLPWRMLVKNQGHIPHYGFTPSGGFAAVSEKVKREIESLEPGIHQFIRLDARDGDGCPLATAFYYLNILQQLNAIDVDRSSVGYSVDYIRHPKDGTPMPVNTMYFNPRAGEAARLTLRTEVTRGHHLWTGKDDLKSAVFMSDELYKRLSDTRIADLIVLRCEEV